MAEKGGTGEMLGDSVCEGEGDTLVCKRQI